MLTVDFLEFLDRFLRILLLVEEIESLIVEPVGGLIRRRVIFLGEKIEAAAGAEGTC
jgi:hypothetical protein